MPVLEDDFLKIHDLLGEREFEAAKSVAYSMLSNGVAGGDMAVGAVHEAMHEEGLGGLEEAIIHYRLSVERERCPTACFRLGRMYWYGTGVDRDWDKACEIFFLSGDMVGPGSALWRGICEEHGCCGDISFENAEYWYRIAIDMGNIIGYRNIAILRKRQKRVLSSLWYRFRGASLAAILALQGKVEDRIFI